MTDTNGIRAELDARVASGHLPGYVAAVRFGDRTEFLTGGRRAVEPDSPPMTEDTLFRIASVTKPMGAALTLALVRAGVLALDDPVTRWLPEADGVRVLEAPDAPLDRTEPLDRPPTVRDLLTGTSGWGISMDETPVRAAMTERDVHPGALPPDLTPDEYAERLCTLPLAFQPGQGWRYDSGIDLLGVLLGRAAGKPLADLVAEHVTGPLGMTDTGFWTPDVARLATAYLPGPDGLGPLDPPDGVFAAPPRFEKLSGGLVSTVADVLRFYSAMADGGAPVLTRHEVAQFTADALTGEQRRQAEAFTGRGASWGMGTGVDVEAAEPWMAPGRWGWTGGTGTCAHVDPVRGTVAVLLTQRAMAGPLDGVDYFWTAAAAAA